MMAKICFGDKVKWTYDHYLNSVSCTRITKVGTYFGLVRHTVKHWRKPDARQLALVRFEGNSRKSCVPVSDIRLAKD